MLEGQEEYDPKKAFLEYKAEQEKAGRPIDPRAISAGQNELEQGEKGGYAIHKEPDIEKVRASYPKGITADEEDARFIEMLKRNFDEEDASSESLQVEGASEDIKDPETNLTEDQLKNSIAELKVTENILINFIKQNESDNIVPNNLVLLMNKVSHKYNINASLNDFPTEIEHLIEKYTRALKNF